jgi:hypothetical protein
VLGVIATAIIPINFLALFSKSNGGTVLLVFVVLAAAQFLLGFVAGVLGLVHWRTLQKGSRGPVMALSILGLFVGLGGVVAVFLTGALLLVGSAGGGWGRPLRLRGKILHPRLRAGADWTLGARPDVARLDRPTRAALEALWLHDAQKEHASVPAFSRVSWMLAAVGAPAELVEWAHRAALEEIDHTRRCFALAAGYGGRSHSVEAMPDLLVGGLDLRGDPLEYLALESLKDGCLLEDFNADVAGQCELVCEDPVTRDVLARIAREERSHAEFSWATLAWLVERDRARAHRAIEKGIAALATIERPTAATDEKQLLIDRAEPAALRAHGRLPDTEWAQLWEVRLAATRQRALALLGEAALSRAA